VATVSDEQAGEQTDGLTYEQARDALAEAVRSLEAGGLTLEESLKVWERGERLAAICAEWLEGARARLAAAMASSADPGGDGTEPGRAEQGGAPRDPGARRGTSR
jgi:exodeoxyribonuclease VII small subunit